jgi:hypothetical protein
MLQFLLCFHENFEDLFKYSKNNILFKFFVKKIQTVVNKYYFLRILKFNETNIEKSLKSLNFFL